MEIHRGESEEDSETMRWYEEMKKLGGIFTLFS